MSLELFYIFFIIGVALFYIFGFNYLFKKFGFEKVEKVEKEINK